jgi:hypothetical protein
MDKFLEKYNCPRLEGIKILNMPIASKLVELAIKNIPT